MNIKLTGAVAAAILAVSALTACGGNDSSSSSSGDYCTDLKAAKAELTSLDNPADLTQDSFNKFQDTVHTLTDEAPAEIKPSWTALGDAFDQIEQILADAGLTFDDFGALTKGNLPKNLTIGQAQELAKKLEALGSTDLTEAGNKVTADAKTRCNVILPNN